jgi:hypothetical protein
MGAAFDQIVGEVSASGAERAERLPNDFCTINRQFLAAQQVLQHEFDFFFLAAV